MSIKSEPALQLLNDQKKKKKLFELQTSTAPLPVNTPLCDCTQLQRLHEVLNALLR